MRAYVISMSQVGTCNLQLMQCYYVWPDRAMDAITQLQIMNLLKTLSFIIQFVCAIRLNNA